MHDGSDAVAGGWFVGLLIWIGLDLTCHDCAVELINLSVAWVLEIKTNMKWAQPFNAQYTTYIEVFFCSSTTIILFILGSLRVCFKDSCLHSSSLAKMENPSNAAQSDSFCMFLQIGFSWLGTKRWWHLRALNLIVCLYGSFGFSFLLGENTIKIISIQNRCSSPWTVLQTFIAFNVRWFLVLPEMLFMMKGFFFVIFLDW